LAALPPVRQVVTKASSLQKGQQVISSSAENLNFMVPFEAMQNRSDIINAEDTA
jgi:hypothetical protein